MECFAGAGGGILGHLLNGHRTICAIEIDRYCREVLMLRQNEGVLPAFPIWDDIRTFDGRPWRGKVDCVSGGFPCQDISLAGNGKGILGSRSSLFFELLRLVDEVAPRFVFLENSPAIVNRGLDVVLRELADRGFNAEWLYLSAKDVGAPHFRQRWWLLGKHSNADNKGRRSLRKGKSKAGRICKKVPDSFSQRCPPGGPNNGKHDGDITGSICKDLSDAMRVEWTERWTASAGGEEKPVTLADVVRCEEQGWPELRGGQESHQKGVPDQSVHASWWLTEPELGRVAHGVANRVDRVRTIGNGQVPLVAAHAFRILFERLSHG